MPAVSAHATHSRCERLAAHRLPVSEARFVDKARATALGKLGVETVGDMVRHYPFRYLDLTHIASLAEVKAGFDATVVGRVHEVKVKKPRPRLTITEVSIVDGTGVLIGVWFNQPYIQQRFSAGDRVAFSGKVVLDFGLKQIRAPFVEKLPEGEAGEAASARIIPVHRTSEGLSTNWLRRLVASSVDDFADVPDHLPSALRRRRGLMPLGAALKRIQFPNTIEEAEEARHRLAYDEILQLQLYMALRRHSLTREHAGVAHPVDGPALARLQEAVPFELTADQVSATAEILADMHDPHPMNRMLLGDVGTGKTLVAAHALAVAADAGAQAAMMAPTEVLANQYVGALGPLLDAAQIRWGLLTGSTPAAERRELLRLLGDGTLQVIFGTHALLEESVEFRRLTLVLVDEQHRFGVNQRLGLRGKGAAPDLLVMTATPIPRSLALTMYGDLAASYLRTRPRHRLGVKTTLVKPSERDGAYERLREAVRDGQQGYVVCALVDESESAEARAATREFERLSTKVFSELRVGLLTGRMRGAEKTRVMRDFRSSEIDVLVATTVIEVGVDVPNASVMIIENAERFGLAQLHQLRGRVGRGDVPGEVYLLAEAKSAEVRQRMEAVVGTNDGFELAEIDLRLRGEGQVLGDRQHGLPALRLASVITDGELIELARVDAGILVEGDPHLTSREHGPLLAELKRTYAAAWEWVSSG